MNAYELADEIEDNISDEMSIAETECLNKTVSMLRQQAKRIEELEKGLENTVGYHCYQAGLQEGRKQHKELSDEEILKIAEQEYGHAVGLYNHNGFARAIIKASRGEE